MIFFLCNFFYNQHLFFLHFIITECHQIILKRAAVKSNNIDVFTKKSTKSFWIQLPIITDELWKYVSRQMPKSISVSQHVVMFYLMWCSLLSETLWPPQREMLSLQTMCRRCCLWLFLKEHKHGYLKDTREISERCEAVPHHGSHKIPNITKICWANTR